MDSPLENEDLIQEVVEREGAVFIDGVKETVGDYRKVVAGYVRGNVRQSCEAQMNAIRARFEEEPGWDSLTLYIDEASAGIGVGSQSLHARRRLIGDARSSNLDVIVVYSSDRLARDGLLFAQIREELQEMDIELVSLTQGRQV